VIETPPAEYRTGIGTDMHPLAAGRKLALGGIVLDWPAGLGGHSDGDAAVHAVIDALLGAGGLGDIGTLFPNTDARFKDADSRELLAAVKTLLDDKGWEIVNLDLIIHAEQPRLEGCKGQMRRVIAGILGMDFASVNVKAKTAEGLGPVGAGEAIAATAAVLLRKSRRRTVAHER
jgi:2-C-methyl-D-erythritol 2,4-cyclodiphosphate synthase